MSNQEIVNRYTKALIYSSSTAKSLGEAVVEAVAKGISLARANLARANLARADLAGAAAR